VCGWLAETAVVGTLQAAVRCTLACRASESWDASHSGCSNCCRARDCRHTAQISMWGKNAVGPSFFTQCTASFVSHRAHIVLLETESIMDMTGGNGTDIQQLILSVRNVAPRAAIVFAGWPHTNAQLAEVPRSWKRVSMEYLQDRRKQFLARTERSLVAVASWLSIDVLYAAGVILSQVEGVHSFSQLKALLYADAVHPTAKGHELLAELAARHIVRQLRAHGCGAGGSAGSAGSAGHLMPPPHTGHANTAIPVDQLCYLSANQIPVASAGNWTLVDEGREKGIPKLGYVSRHVGDELRLGPIAPGACGTATVNLGYLRSWRADQGAFFISCSGCTCFGKDAKHYTAFESYPIVQTSSLRSRQTRSLASYNLCHGKECQADVTECDDPSGTGATTLCATITIPNRFKLTKPHADVECFIHLTHLTHPQDMPLNASRVRIDTLSFMGVTAFGCIGAAKTRGWTAAAPAAGISSPRNSSGALGGHGRL
jgi:hypothetical protein